ncbi:translation initiation factor 2 [Streptomyces sp. NPDC050085]|uniref:translation initiation factor 2 n=1 Tax=Streptomyces sp. NPDC050085 TaxID=3365600 RepID=UPI0037A6CA65
MLFAVRSAAALHRVLDVLPVFEGDHRVRRLFTLAPGSAFGVDALAALEGARAGTVPWDEAVTESYDLIVAASPKGELHLLHGPLALLPHGAGFNKSLEGEGAADSASGLDPLYLLRPDDGRPLAALHALAHPEQIDRLADRCPPARERAVVVGDPTLDRLLESRTRRDRYRAALGTGRRRLVVLVSTWGPDALLVRRPALASRLATELPLDSYQLAVVAHPNTHSEPGTFDLAERLPPEAFLARPHEEWATLLVAADAVVTDHGSTALYAAALGRAVVSAYDGSAELLPATPMARLLDAAPRLPAAADRPGALLGELLDELLDGHPPEGVREAARAAFADDALGHSLDRLRTALYAHLELPAGDQPPPVPRLLPSPRRPLDTPAVFAVRIDVTPEGVVEVERRPVRTDVPAHHVAAEEDAVQVRYARQAAVLYRRDADPAAAARWTAEALDRYPSCRTAAVLLSPELCLVRRRAAPGTTLTVRISTGRGPGAVDPATALSAVHARPSARPGDTVNFRAGNVICAAHLLNEPGEAPLS